MKKTIQFLLVLLFFSTASAQKNDTGHSGKSAVMMISQNEFKKKLFNYEDTTALYSGKTAVVVDFYADWCGPCRKLAPIMERMAKKYNKRIIFYKINVDRNREIARFFDIRNIPSLLLIKTKERPQKIIGLPQESQLIEIIDTVLLNEPKKQ